MIKINADQISTKLNFSYYILVGNDPYLSQLVQDTLVNNFKKRGFNEQFTFVIDNQTDWSAIYDKCHALTLFSDRLLIRLDFGDVALNQIITSKLNLLCDKLSDDIALVFNIAKLTKTQQNANWYNKLSNQLAIVNCSAPDSHTLPVWLKNHLSTLRLRIDASAIALLCYYYEGNLLALTQIIEQIQLLHPEQKLTYDIVEKYIHDNAIFTPFHWIDAILSIKYKRAIHILQQLKNNDTEPLILLRLIQRELILLINLKKRSLMGSFKQACDEFKIWQNRRDLYFTYLNRVEQTDLYQILSELSNIEILIKSDYNTNIWNQLSQFSLSFMGINIYK